MKFLTKLAGSIWWTIGWLVYTTVLVIANPVWYTGVLLGIWIAIAIADFGRRWYTRQAEKTIEAAWNRLEQDLYDQDWNRNWTPVTTEISTMKENNNE